MSARAKERLAVLELVEEQVLDDVEFERRLRRAAGPEGGSVLDDLEARGLIFPRPIRRGSGEYLLTNKGAERLERIRRTRSRRRP